MSSDTHEYPWLQLSILILWLETRPPNESYDYTSIRDCLVARFARQFVPVKFVGAFNIKLRNGSCIPLPPVIDRISVEEPHTMGAALSRARKIASGASQ